MAVNYVPVLARGQYCIVLPVCQSQTQWSWVLLFVTTVYPFSLQVNVAMRENRL